MQMVKENCIYLRKSRADLEAEAKGEGETLAKHERALLDLARKNKLKILKIYKELVSGETIAARPVMQKLLQEVEQGIWNGVLVMEVERLARGDTIDQGIVSQAFKFSDTKIITPLKTYDPNNEFDTEYFEFSLFMSRREYVTINRRLQRGRLAAVKEGKYIASSPPYGYTRVKLEHEKGFTLTPNPEEAEVVRLIYELYTQGEQQPDGTLKRLGVALICRKLNNLKIKPKKADTWVVASIRDILHNPIYMGKIRWNWRPVVKKMIDGKRCTKRPHTSPEDWVLADGQHPAIVPSETWELAQYYLKQNPPHPAPSQYPIKNSLSGVVYCGVCGRSMVRRPYTLKDISPTLMCPVSSCKNISSKLEYVEERLLEALKRWLADYKVIYNINENKVSSNGLIEMKKKSLQKLENEILNLEKQMSNLHDLLEQGIYTTDVFLERTRLLTERITTAQRDKIILAEDIELELNREDARKTVIPKVEQVIAIYTSTDNPKIKNDLLKEILEKVIYTKHTNTRWHGDPYDFEIELFPKLPK